MDEQWLACAIQRGRTGTLKELIPLMAVLQHHKSKLRPIIVLEVSLKGILKCVSCGLFCAVFAAESAISFPWIPM